MADKLDRSLDEILGEKVATTELTRHNHRRPTVLAAVVGAAAAEVEVEVLLADANVSVKKTPVTASERYGIFFQATRGRSADSIV
ncbi:hypothetical protein ColKHC_01035 [Colletotrichum higginsianum]|nr:hypothetical protein ColKHC_01035 [Colletotrichum higginsianum]